MFIQSTTAESRALDPLSLSDPSLYNSGVDANGTPYTQHLANISLAIERQLQDLDDHLRGKDPNCQKFARNSSDFDEISAAISHEPTPLTAAKCKQWR